ncbi:MAG: LPS assembly lipoprotein LptE [Gammaproteobacteria bacterium]|nr:LPS assembly lipoprotein LptE [Gammaproteobacteria bacterium]
MRIALILVSLQPLKITGLRLVMLGFVLSLLVSCGFHLRGAYELPESMSVTYIKAGNQNSELVRHLKRTLKASDIELVDSEQLATGILSIDAEKQDKRVLSVDSRGRAREYELQYEISFELRTAAGQVQVAQQTLKLERDFLFDTEDVLGKGREEATLIKDMQQDMVRLMLLRLSSHNSISRKLKPACQGSDCQPGEPSQ